MRDVFVELQRAVSLPPLRDGMRDALLPVLFAFGLAGLAMGPCSEFTIAALGTLFAKAFFEELVFRALLQNQMAHLLPTWPPLFMRFRTSAFFLTKLTPANAFISLLFALAHIPTQSVAAALSTFLPSLAFGLVWTRTRSLWLCVALHAWYNVTYLYL